MRLRVRADVDDQALSRLHALAFNGPYRPTAWGSRLQQHSLTWITAHGVDDRLVGFVNVAWDGGLHAFLLDTMVDPDGRRAGVGTALVQRAAKEAAAAGCEWLHVDFEEHLGVFYLGACGLRPTSAGLRRLSSAARHHSADDRLADRSATAQGHRGGPRGGGASIE